MTAIPATGLRVLAAAAHPDDIEFSMAGTLLLLGQAGASLHMWCLADGACGTLRLEAAAIRSLRWNETRNSARLAGAEAHPPVARDLLLFYDAASLARVAAVIRRIKPHILLLPSPQDYMEDHQNACRLLAGAAFVRGMPNFRTRPASKAWQGDMALYHAMPHGLRDGMGKLVRPGQYVDIRGTLPLKRQMLACHRSQMEWLDRSQGMGSYIGSMEAMGKQLGRMSGKFSVAEGWRRHSHLGYSASDWDPLTELLKGLAWTDPRYKRSLDQGA